MFILFASKPDIHIQRCVHIMHNQNYQFNLHIKFIFNKHVPRYTFEHTYKNNVLKSFTYIVHV